LLPSTPTWRVVKKYIEEQIATGVYPPGSWLPSVRVLAADLGINRNTASKVYQSLASDGYLRSVRGKGVQVVAVPNEVPAPGTLFENSIQNIVRDAYLAGLPAQTVIERFLRAVREKYESRLIRVAFIECTDWDTRVISEDLSRHLGLPVAAITLGDFQRAPEVVAGCDLVATTFFHLQEVSEGWPTAGPELVGISHVVSHASLLEISRLPRRSRILIVGPNERTLQIVERIVSSYVTGLLEVHTLGDEAELRRKVEEADAIINASEAQDAITSLARGKPVIRIAFHIEDQSLEYLRQAVRSVLVASIYARSDQQSLPQEAPPAVLARTPIGHHAAPHPSSDRPPQT
jgi:DNA-binding transcriptional regulator YhcF (GntR family)